jgi:fatty acid desaturase
MFAGRVSWWYLIAVVPTVALAVTIGASERGASTAGHRGRLAAAVTVVVAVALVVVVTAHLLPGFSLLLLILLLAGALLGWLTNPGDAEEAQ